MTEIRDGLTTAMRYAVYALGREFGPAPHAPASPNRPPTDPGADANFYGLLRKPPYEAYKAYDVMRREWGLDVVPVCPDRDTVNGDPSYPSLAAVPGRPVECVVSFLPSHLSQTLADDMAHAGVPTLWRMFGPIINGYDDEEQAIYRRAGIRVVKGCVLAHWDVVATGIPAHELAHHACFIHGLGKRKLRGRQVPSSQVHVPSVKPEPVLVGGGSDD